MRLANKASIFRAELYAITLAMDFIRRSKYTKFIVFLDSLSSLEALNGFKIEVDLVLKYQRLHKPHEGWQSNCLVFSTRAMLCHIILSCIFLSCGIVPHFHVLHFLSLYFHCVLFSYHIFSRPVECFHKFVECEKTQWSLRELTRRLSRWSITRQ